jgi:hypothetical protein
MVPTRITLNGHSTEANYRLKGDYLDHINSDKWSYRIVSEDTINQANKFSLHHPMRRNNINEFLWQFACDREGIISLDYDLVQVKVNSTDFGLYAFEEHFGKNFCSKRKLNGFVIRYEEKAFWQSKLQLGSNSKEAFMQAKIDSYNSKEIKKDSGLIHLEQRATAKLDTLRSTSFLDSASFDIKKIATYFALSDLLSGQHALVWHNLRFYMDPQSKKLEPIAFDGDLNGETTELSVQQSYDNPDHWSFRTKCFKSEAFKADYLKALAKISNPTYVDALMLAFNPTKEKYQNILNWEFSSYEFDPSFVHLNAVFIQKKINELKNKLDLKYN